MVSEVGENLSIIFEIVAAIVQKVNENSFNIVASYVVYWLLARNLAVRRFKLTWNNNDNNFTKIITYIYTHF